MKIKGGYQVEMEDKKINVDSEGNHIRKTGVSRRQWKEKGYIAR